ncbi:MAG: lysophospholipid acyltransferase family protein [Planctomycetia bacterium]|nr:lysophospholipid acyltransferase family protein [Planctomycetia bacterium]
MEKRDIMDELTPSNSEEPKEQEQEKKESNSFRRTAFDVAVGRYVLAFLAQFLSGATSRWYASQPDVCQRVYYANHTSHLDILVIWASLPSYVRRVVRPVAAKDYWSAGPIRRYIATRLFNAILLERQNVKAHHSPIDVMLEEMGDKYSIIIFPEGGRQSSGEMAEFKSGLYHLCKKKPGLELIPIYIDNMNRILPRGAFLPVPLLSHLVFGPPIYLEKNERKQDFLERARQAVLDLKGK